ncbi:MAG: hypothetical protein OXG08_09445 [Gammaproteobacteria bacterium]|nr:hypothetical protein [Gammaproteobacteria bacterium]
MNLRSILLIFATIPFLVSCASFSKKQLDNQDLREDTDPLIADLREFDKQEATNDAVERYEEAKVECENLNGTWVGLLHGDSRDTHTNYYRCRSNEDSLPYRDSHSWSRKGLVPYDLAVTYSNLTSKVVSFTRVYLDLDESDDEDQ